MILKKESKFVNLLKTLLEGSKTKDFSTNISAIGFSSDGNIIVHCNSVKDLEIKIKSNSDFDASLPKIAATFILASLENNDTVEITKNENKVKIGNFSVTTLDVGNVYYNDSGKGRNLFFTKEQFNSLEKDFKYSLCNCFVNPKMCDTIVFGVNEGSVYEVLPNPDLYCIKQVNGVVDTVYFEQNFGHSSFMFVLPKIVFDIIKNEENINICLDSERNIIYSNEIKVGFNCVDFGCSAFINKLGFRNFENGISFKPFFKVKDIISSINKNYNSKNDEYYYIEEGKILLEESVVSTIDLPENFLITINNIVLEELLNILSEEAVLKISDNIVIIKDNDNYYFLPNIISF